MRKILGITFFLFTLSIIGHSQLIVKFSSSNVNQGDSANINVTIDNFENFFGMQLSINWDSTKFKYGKIDNINPTYADKFTFATPGPGNPTKQGTLGFLFEAFNQPNIPDNTILFRIKLKATGALCDSTEIFTSNNPVTSEYYDANFNAIPITSANVVKGKAKINGPNCGSGDPNPTDSTIIATAGSLITQPGQMICIPIKVKKFEKVEAVQSKIKWDPTVLQFKEIKNALSSFNGNEGNVVNGSYTFLWLPVSPNIDATLPDGSTFFEICFTVIGGDGSMSVIDLVDMDNETETEYTKNGVSHPYLNEDGKVTVTENPPATLKVTVADVTVNSEGTVDVSFKADNFIDVTSFSFAVTWDPAVAEFVERNSDGLGANWTQNPSSGRVNLLWLEQSGSPKTLPNGSILFNIRFKAAKCLTAADLSTLIEIKDQPNFEVIFIGANAVELPYEIDNGSLTVDCDGPPPPPECKINAVNNITCNGANNGSINATVTGGDQTCQCIWKRGGQVFGSPLPTNNCNLTNLPPGDYTLEVTCGGVVQTTCTATIIEPAAIQIGGNVTNVMCGNKGSIQLNVTNAINPAEYKWDNIMATTKDISGLNAGTYTVTVTDFNKCTASMSFVVSTVNPSPLAVDFTKTDVKCFGEPTGSINLNISGGCPTIVIDWQDNTNIKTPSRSNLASGTYNVTVTDGSTPANSTSLSITIVQPTVALSVSGTATGSTGNNGSVNITAAGGTGNKKYNWSGPSLSSQNEDINGLVPGTFTVTVTDDNNCSVTASFVVDIIDPGSDELLDTVRVVSEDDYAGYGVSCVNLCDGVIAGIVGNTGKAPYTVTLTGIGNKTLNLTQPGSFTFADLCTGTYTVRVTDADNTSQSKVVVITSPSILRIERDITCSDGIQSNGEIDLTVSGGAGGYTYAWSDGSTTQDVDDLEIGRYSVVVSDVNGCQQLLQNISILDCTSTGTCFEGSPIITPGNADGANDYFIIDCAITSENELFIYDRWGRLVFSRKNYDNTWNGVNLQGEDLPENGYMWVFNVINSDGTRESYNGTVTVLRD